MTPLETIKAFCENCEKEIKALNPIYSCPYAAEKKLCPQFQMVEKPLKALEILANMFHITVTEIQGYKYLRISTDIRRPDTLIRISEAEYKIFEEVL